MKRQLPWKQPSVAGNQRNLLLYNFIICLSPIFVHQGMMVNLRNRNLIQPPARLQGANVQLNPPPYVPPPPLPQAGRGAGVGRGARARQQQAQPQQITQPTVNEYRNMLGRMGLSVAAITSLENLGLDNIQAFSEITEKDIPSIVAVCN